MSGVATVKTGLSAVKSDAKSEFSSQIDAVETAGATLDASVTDAKSEPSVSTLQGLVTTSSSFIAAVQTLVADIKATC